MNQKFQAAVHQRDEMTYVKLAGVIDEDNELTELTEKIPGGTVVIDLADIERINSCGVRDWVNWLGRVEKQGARPVLVECSPAIVAQINLVNNFTGGGVVKSFFAPYFCPNCDREKVLLVESAEMGPPPHKAPTCRCDECDGVMDFDDMEDSYFAFLSNAKKVTEAQKIQAVVAEFAGADGEKSKIRSRVGSGGTGAGVGSGSLPSVPSLPSIAKSATQPTGMGAGSKGGFTPIPTGSKAYAAALSRVTGSSDPLAGAISKSASPGSGVHKNAAQPRSGIMVYVLVGVLLIAIAVLAILLFSGASGGTTKKKTTTAVESPTSVALR